MKIVVVTGATSGLGNLLVKEFIRVGCTVFAGYRNEALRKDLAEISESVVPFYVDMAKKESVVEAARFISERVERIDTLINAAGCVFAGAMEFLEVDKIREQFEVNTFSHLELTQRLFPVLHGAKVINISSMASFGIFPFIAPYCASKRALDILFNSMQLECGRGIKVVSVKPGVIKTPLWDKSIEGNKAALGGSEKYRAEFEFLKKNAQKNNNKGLAAKEVVDFILKIERLKNPKPSYTIGKDAKFAEIFSKLPQGWVNFAVKKGLKSRMNKANKSEKMT